ncbi:metallophosphoesterase [Emergencia timonensis]|uniref:metallophosphoesterase n=1 Tax=Emergencia timonensis TaxID=1776384 RepID=UPI003992B92C
MKILKRILIVFTLLILVIGGCIYYAFKIEPYRVTLNEFTLNEEKPDREHLKIVQISDLHIKADFTYKNLDKVIKKVNEQNPDIVIFTGDLYDNYAIYRDDENIVTALQKIEASYGKIAIWGNRDYGGGAERTYAAVMEDAGFTLLKNENWYITLNNGKRVLFTGLDDALLGHPVMPDGTKIYDSDYELLLSHEPDNVEPYMNYDYDIALSGHSHGGQINIPFLPFVNDMALTVTALSSKYSGGMYTFDDNAIKQLYVNTGIGTTHISARFGVVPEVTLFHIYV